MAAGMRRGQEYRTPDAPQHTRRCVDVRAVASRPSASVQDRVRRHLAGVAARTRQREAEPVRHRGLRPTGVDGAVGGAVTGGGAEGAEVETGHGDEACRQARGSQLSISSSRAAAHPKSPCRSVRCPIMESAVLTILYNNMPGRPADAGTRMPAPRHRPTGSRPRFRSPRARRRPRPVRACPVRRSSKRRAAHSPANGAARRRRRAHDPRGFSEPGGRRRSDLQHRSAGKGRDEAQPTRKRAPPSRTTRRSCLSPSGPVPC
jgi:hypothetical protein